MGELYSIAGLFSDFPGMVPWGGHFVKEDNRISGQLIDLYGPSRLEGIIEKGALNFTKSYDGCNNDQVFLYSFSRKDRIWSGEFSSPAYSGRTVCRTNLCLANLVFSEADMSLEGSARALIDRMVEDGYLQTYKDPATGETMIRPLSNAIKH